MKQGILDVYSNVFSRIGKFPGNPYKFQLKPNAKPARHAPRKVLIHLQEGFHKETRNLEELGILEETKEVTEWVNSFVIVEKKLPIDSSNSHVLGATMEPIGSLVHWNLPISNAIVVYFLDSGSNSTIQ